MWWVPVDLQALAWLPKQGERPYSQVEALFSIQTDFWHRRPASIQGYADQWGWHRRRVRDFLSQVGAEIVGQTGRRPGQLRPSNGPASGPASGPATAQQIFRDFGQIGDQRAETGPASGPATVPKVAHTYLYRDLYQDKNTTPPTPQVAVAGGDKINDFNVLSAKMVDHEIKNGRKIRDLNRYKAAIEKRLIQQGGPAPEEIDGIRPSYENPEIARTRKYLESLDK